MPKSYHQQWMDRGLVGRLGVRAVFPVLEGISWGPGRVLTHQPLMEVCRVKETLPRMQQDVIHRCAQVCQECSMGVRERSLLIGTRGWRNQGGARIWGQALWGGGAKIECSTLRKPPPPISFSKNFAAGAASLPLLYPTNCLSNSMQMNLDSNTGCYKITGVNMYYLYPMWCRGRGQNFSPQTSRGASFQCTGISEFLHPPPPVQINNDCSLISFENNRFWPLL